MKLFIIKKGTTQIVRTFDGFDKLECEHMAKEEGYNDKGLYLYTYNREGFYYTVFKKPIIKILDLIGN